MKEYIAEGICGTIMVREAIAEDYKDAAFVLRNSFFDQAVTLSDGEIIMTNVYDFDLFDKQVKKFGFVTQLPL